MVLGQDFQVVFQILSLTLPVGGLGYLCHLHTLKFSHLTMRVLDQYVTSRVPVISNILLSKVYLIVESLTSIRGEIKTFGWNSDSSSG